MDHRDYSINRSQAILTGVLVLCSSALCHAVPVCNPTNGHYYEYIADAQSWDDANSIAESTTYSLLKGHLATITSSSEQDFVMNIVLGSVSGDFCWLGGFQPDGSPEPDGNWQWVTREPWGDYTHWGPHRPNNELGNEDCLGLYPTNEYNRGDWNDHVGSNSYPYIIEYEHHFPSENLLVNGSFESPGIDKPNKALQSGDTYIEGWVVVGGAIDYLNGYWEASDGTHSLDLKHEQSLGGIEQAFPTVPGHMYLVAFDMAGNWHDEGPCREKWMRVSAAEQHRDFSFTNVKGHTDTNMGWRRCDWSFIANSTETTISFRSFKHCSIDAWGAALDNVSVYDAMVPVVELNVTGIESDEGDANSFWPGDIVTVNLQCTNTADEVDAIVTLNVFDALWEYSNSDASKIYDSHLSNEDCQIHLATGDGQICEFSFEIPPCAPPGHYRLLAAVRAAPWEVDQVLDTTAPGPATPDFSQDAYLVGFTVEPNLADCTKGVTVLVHGYCIGPLTDEFNPIDDYWDCIGLSCEEHRHFVESLLVANGGGLVYTYQPDSGEFAPCTHGDINDYQSDNGHVILVHNWGLASNDAVGGQAEAAAEALLCALLDPDADGEIDTTYINLQNPSQSRRLHFIGHSRGGPVVSEVVQRLGAYGVSVDYVTYLDSHDWDEEDIVGGVPFDDNFHDPAVQVWSNVLYADNFWQTSTLPLEPSGRLLGHLDESTTDSEYYFNHDLTNLWIEPFGGGHAQVMTWYMGTVRPGSCTTAWYVDDHHGFERNGYTTGFSRWVSLGAFDNTDISEGIIKPALDPRDPNTQSLIPYSGRFEEDEDDNYATTDFFMGTFDLNDIESESHDALAGWSYHGGDGGGIVRDGRLRLGPPTPLNSTYYFKTHNRFYVPYDAEGIKFNCSITAPTTSGDELTVTLSSPVGDEQIGTLSLWSNGDIDCQVSIPPDSPSRNSIRTLTFSLGPAPTAHIEIDNIEIVRVPCMSDAHPHYNAWENLGMPYCWCSKYQCDGDADGMDSGTPFYYRVFTDDLNQIVRNWKKKIDDPVLDPCADLDHKDSGIPFRFRVFTGDLNILVENWKKTDADLPGDCPRSQ